MTVRALTAADILEILDFHRDTADFSVAVDPETGIITLELPHANIEMRCMTARQHDPTLDGVPILYTQSKGFKHTN